MAFLRRHLLLGSLALGGASSVGCAQRGTASTAAPAPSALTGKVSWLVRNMAVENDWQSTVAILAFQSASPQVSVELVLGGSDYEAKLTSMVVAGQSPEVWTHFGGVSFVDYLHRGWLQELLPYTTRDKLDLNAFLPNTVDWFKLKNKLYALPFSQSYGTWVYYNKQLLAKAGVKPPPVDVYDKSWTWDALVDMAKKLTTDQGTPQATYGLYWFNDTAQYISQNLAMQWGGDIFVPEHYKDGIAQKTQLDAKEAVEAHQARQDLIYRTHVIPTPDDVKALGVTGDLFTAGKIGFMLNNGGGKSYTADVKDFEWGIAPIPAKAKSVGPNFTDAWMLGNSAPNKEGGWGLIEYLVSPDGERAYVQSVGQCSALKATEDEFFKKIGARMPLEDLKKATAGSLQHSWELSQHTFARWADILAAIRQAVNPLWQNQATAGEALKAGKATVDQVVAQAYRDYRDLLT
jgi:multiple sugar transport system substrate-binding protein